MVWKPKFKKKELHDKLLHLALYNVVKEGLDKALENVEDYGNEPEVVENVIFSTYSDIRDKIKHLKHYNKLTKRKYPFSSGRKNVGRRADRETGYWQICRK